MPVLNINPTRMEMTRMKRRLATAKRGHKLLKDKRDELVRRFIVLARENYNLRLQVERALGLAMKDFALARAVMEPGALRHALMYPARQAAITIGQRSILSVKVPEYRMEEIQEDIEEMSEEDAEERQKNEKTEKEEKSAANQGQY